MHCLALWGQDLRGQRLHPGGRAGQKRRMYTQVLTWSFARCMLNVSRAVAEDGDLDLIVTALWSFRDRSGLGNVPAWGPERVKNLFKVTQL